jgi:RasGEF domain
VHFFSFDAFFFHIAHHSMHCVVELPRVYHTHTHTHKRTHTLSLSLACSPLSLLHASQTPPTLPSHRELIRPPRMLAPANGWDSIQAKNYHDIPPLEFARQLCVYDYAVYDEIQPVEFLDLAWSKPKLHHRAPNLIELKNHFNQLSRKIAACILSQDRIFSRIVVLKWVISVCQVRWDCVFFFVVCVFICVCTLALYVCVCARLSVYTVLGVWFVYVCMYIYIYIYIYICVYVRMFTLSECMFTLSE